MKNVTSVRSPELLFSKILQKISIIDTTSKPDMFNFESIYRTLDKDSVSGAMCYFCAQTIPADSMMITCSACRFIRVCGPTCYKNNWNRHKNLCAGLRQDNI